MEKKFWYVGYYGESGTGIVDYEGEPRSDGDPEYAMKFESEKEAGDWIEKHQAEWGSSLVILDGENGD